MASGVTSDKIICDLQDCVVELKKEFLDYKIPINDDNTVFHRFCAKLEYVLQNGMKERTSLLGSKKGYWEYFCHCLATTKEIHDGLKYVKSLPELKTSLGKGRAFIRFCLMHQCLADTLQNCFMNTKISSDWYYDRSVPKQQEQWTVLINSLYELNDLHFDLSPRGHDLDVTWPTFARKLFVSPQSWRPPSRSISISSLISTTSLNESGLTLQSPSECPSPENIAELEQLRGELSRAEASRNSLQEKLESYQKAEQEFHRFRSHFEKKNKDLEARWQKVEEILEKKQTQEVIQKQIDEKLSFEYGKKVEQINVEWQNKQKQLLEKEEQLQSTIRILEEEKAVLLSKIFVLQEDLNKYQDTIKEHGQIVGELKNNINNLKEEKLNLASAIEKSDGAENLPDVNFNMSERIGELMSKLEVNEKALQQMVTSKEELDGKFQQMQQVNSNLRQLAANVECENTKLLKEISDMKSDFQSCKCQLSEVQNVNSVLENKILELQSRSENMSSLSQNLCISESELDDQALDFGSLLKQMKNIISDLQNQSKTSDEEPFVLPYLLRLKRVREALERNVAEENNKLKENEARKRQIEKNVNLVKSLARKQEDIIDSLHSKLECSLKENRNLNSQMCVLRDMLQFHFSEGSGKSTDTAKHHLQTNTNGTAVSQNISIGSASMYSVDDEPNNFIENLAESGQLNISDSDASSLLHITQITLSKLHKLTVKVEKLQQELESSHVLNANLISRVQDQELQLRGITKELEAAQKLVSVLNKEHKKLQTAEDILKYELQEKRKLLTRLRRQLESTREDWNRVRQKNSESEAEWQNLRQEFVRRHKQASEESGFVDDNRGSEERSGNDKKHSTEESISPAPSDSSLPQHSPSPSCGAEGGNIEEINQVTPNKSRLEILEEQCQLLYSSLLQGSKKSEVLNKRLHALYRGSEERIENASNGSLGHGETTSSPELSLGGEQSQEESDMSVFQDLVDPQTSKENFRTSSPADTKDVQLVCHTGSFDSEAGGDSIEDVSVSNTDLTELPDDCSRDNFDSDEAAIFTQQDTADLIYDENSTDIEVSSEDVPSAEVSELPCSSDSVDILETDACQTHNRDFVATVRKSALKGLVGRFRDEQQSHKAREADLHSHIESLESAKSDLEKKLELLQRENMEISSKDGDFRKRTEFIFRKERNEFVKQIVTLKEEQRDLQKQVAEMEQQTKVVEIELEHTRRELLLSKAAKEQELAALQFQLSTEALKYERALKNYSEQDSGLSDMRRKVSDQEHLILALEDALREIREERESEKERQWEELEEIQVALMTRDDECCALNEELRKSFAQLDEERSNNTVLVSQLAEVKTTSQNAMAAMEVELIQLRSDSRQLRKKLVKLIKEKDILWKRTDHLSYLQRIQIADKWMADHEANHCLGCKNRFSFMFRKHHCRLCGRIFCHSCANNWLLTTASSRRTRVCNECYVQQLQLEKEIRRGSDVPAVAEDSEDDESPASNEMQHPLFINSFDSNISPSMSNSVTSLPAREVDSTQVSPQLFASAPDLRWILTNPEDQHTRSRPKFISPAKSITETEEDINKNHDFDVISDEEIAKSLSTSSPYNPYAVEGEHPDANIESGVSMTLTRTTREIEAAGDDGINGELWVNAGTSCGIPVLCEDPPVVLQWSFITDPKIISLTLVFQESQDGNSQKVLLSSSHPKPEDHAELHHPGLYILLFDNSVSRVLPKKVKYTLQVRQLPANENSG